MNKSTKDRILDAAEKLFAEGGFSETSLRDITAAAGVNLAAVNYHFQSKEALIVAVFDRRVGPINERRLQMLDEAGARAAGGPIAVEELLRAFIEPVFAVGPGLKGCPIGRLIGRLYLSADNLFETVFLSQFAAVKARFAAAVQNTFPDMPRQEIFWRMHFAIGAFAHILAGLHHISMVNRELGQETNLKDITEHMIRFLSAGFRAPYSTQPEQGDPQ